MFIFFVYIDNYNEIYIYQEIFEDPFEASKLGYIFSWFSLAKRYLWNDFILNTRGMRIFFKLLRGLFLFLTIAVGIMYLRGEILFSAQNFVLIKNILIPGYLVFCGLIVGYLIATLWAGREQYQDFDDKEKIAIKSFIIGIVLGVVLAILYIFI